jgi:asparaginyl-tRNA synthetase
MFFKKTIRNFFAKKDNNYSLPEYNSETHYLEVGKAKYFRDLTILRHHIKMASDYYWSNIQKAYNVDLFMLTPSVSSPMGPGSDSEAVEIKFGNLQTYLVDSSQFGFEPILMNGLEKVYCYLPSMRGENPDKRHLNQFFHCEAEIKGPLENLKPQIEGYIKHLAKTLLDQKQILKNISANYEVTIQKLENLLATKKFTEIEFDYAVDLLIKNGFSQYVNQTEHGRDISSAGELEIMKLLKTNTPVWINNYDRDRVAFYQKPHKNNLAKVINSDLIFPAILETSFGGEIVGCGQRQDNAEEIYESIKRQGLSSVPYEWYINLRRQPNYSTTAGFGLGIERFIAWTLNRDDIKDVILYPRLKNILTHP